MGSITITAGGSGYATAPTVSFSGGGGSGVTATSGISGGVGSFTITAGGSGYTSYPTVALTGGGGSGASATAVVTGAINSVTLTSGGTGYTSPPTVSFGGGGSGATATATLSFGGGATAVKVSLLYPANGSEFTYSEIVPEYTSTYEGLALATPVAAASFSPSVWAAFALSAVGQNAYISVQRLVGTTLYPAQTVNIAFATNQLKGTVYYNTYGTSYAYNYWNTRGGGYFGGATLAIQPGATTPSPIEGYTSESSLGQGCRVCHVVSANGNQLITELGTSYGTSETLSLPTSTWQASAANTSEEQMNATFAWAGLYPDASLLFTNGAGLPGGVSGASGLFSMANPAAPTAVTVTGLPAINAGTPAFSPDGQHVAFNFNGGSGTLTALSGTGTASHDGASLGVIDFNGSTAFSNGRVVATPGSNGLIAPSGGSSATGKAWFPSFIPDANDDVVFHYETYTNGRDTAGTRSRCDTVGPVACQDEGVHSELWWVPSTSNATANRLNCANGVSDLNCPDNCGRQQLPPD